MEELTTIVIFGASGDLTRRKLMPALYDLHRKGRLPERWQIIGVSRSLLSDEAFRELAETGVRDFSGDVYDPTTWNSFESHVFYRPVDIGDVEGLRDLDYTITQKAGDGVDNRIYHLSIAPQLYETAVTNLGAADLVDQSHGWRRVVVEKPFGNDLQTARSLNDAVHSVLSEEQVYRIDHYLGKETVQNILVFRFANTLFEPVWNRNYIDHVQITVAESVDVGHRAQFYDGVGVLRDMVQNHMMQLLALVAAEPPASYAADALRNEKAKVLSAVRPIDPSDFYEHVVLAQYEGYQETAGVAPDSWTATYAAIRLYIDNWRWQGVPFYLRSGKAMAEKTTEITIFFKRPPHIMFPMSPGEQLNPNRLSICIQPDEGIHFLFQAKVPDTAAEMRPVEMSFHYEDSFGNLDVPDAYERLILDVLKGDMSLFTRSDSIETSWKLVDAILEGCILPGAPILATYDQGSWGPIEADELIAHDDYCWTVACTHRVG